MTERTRVGARRISMRRWAIVLAASVVGLAGCGDSGEGDKAAEPSTPPATANTCMAPKVPELAKVSADLDGDGNEETVTLTGRAGACAPALSVSGLEVHQFGLEAELTPDPKDLRAIKLPGHEGEVVMVSMGHPRGGLQLHLVGYANGEFGEVGRGGKPALAFIATDAPTEYRSARCTSAGFEVTEAQAHQPIGVAPSWDVYRTAYEVDGNDVTAGARTEVADNVLDEDLGAKYSDLMQYRLFENCRS